MVMNADEEGMKVKDGVSREQMRAKSLGIGFCFVWMAARLLALESCLGSGE